MENDLELLRKLQKIEESIPDRNFFSNAKGNIKDDDEFSKKSKIKLFPNLALRKNKKNAKIDIEIAREKIKSFNNSFKYNSKKKQLNTPVEFGLMGIQEMNEFRSAIKESAETESDSYTFRALEGIVKYIDLKNSGVTVGKQEVLFDCLKKLAMVLMENGGLSMFHATWFYSIYKEFIANFQIFQSGELDQATRVSNSEVRKIAQKLVQKQYEVPQYQQLINMNSRDIRQLLRYSKDPYVKRSVHGQRGCTFEHIRKVFQDKSNPGGARTSNQNYLNEINIIMSYALFFTRFPIMHPLVEKIARSIPNLSTETSLYKEKIMISLNLVQLDLNRGIAMSEGSDGYEKKIFEMAYAIYTKCKQSITDNRLDPITLSSDIQAFPFLKQAAILISQKKTFLKNLKTFSKMVENSKGILGRLKESAQNGNRYLSRAYHLVEAYDHNLSAIAEQIKSELIPDIHTTFGNASSQLKKGA